MDVEFYCNQLCSYLFCAIFARYKYNKKGVQGQIQLRN